MGGGAQAHVSPGFGADVGASGYSLAGPGPAAMEVVVTVPQFLCQWWGMGCRAAAWPELAPSSREDGGIVISVLVAGCRMWGWDQGLAAGGDGTAISVLTAGCGAAAQPDAASSSNRGSGAELFLPPNHLVSSYILPVLQTGPGLGMGIGVCYGFGGEQMSCVPFNFC